MIQIIFCCFNSISFGIINITRQYRFFFFLQTKNKIKYNKIKYAYSSLKFVHLILSSSLHVFRIILFL